MAPKDNRGPKAEDLAEHMHLVHRVVAHFVRRLPRSVRREDLAAAGTLGLFHALRASEHTCEEMFASYARIRIKGAILDELRRNDWAPRRRRIANDTQPEAPAGAAGPTNASAPTTTPVTVIGFDDLPAQTLGTLDATSGGASYGGHSPEGALEQKARFAALHRYVDALPTRERAIVRMRYFEGIASKAIASTMGLSEARISQLHARAMARLRAMMAEQGDEMELAA